MAQQIFQGFPLSFEVQAELAERIQSAMNEERTEVLGCYDKDTGFGLVVHVVAEGPCFWECVGPLSERQADAWIHGLQDELKTSHRRFAA